jgi:hypothetical protein
LSRSLPSLPAVGTSAALSVYPQYAERRVPDDQMDALRILQSRPGAFALTDVD